MNRTAYLIVAFIIAIAAGIFISQDKETNMNLRGPEFVEKFETTSLPVLIDVRTPEEYNAGHIDGALNMNVSDVSFEDEIKELNPSNTYFIYCRSGSRSAVAREIMEKNGIKNIYELEGGLISNPDLLE